MFRKNHHVGMMKVVIVDQGTVNGFVVLREEGPHGKAAEAKNGYSLFFEIHM